MDLSILVPILSLGCIGIFACGFYLCLCAHPNRVNRRFQRRTNQTRGTNYSRNNWNQGPSSDDYGFNHPSPNNNGFNLRTNIDHSFNHYPAFIDHDFNQPSVDHNWKPWERPETPPPSYQEATGGFYNNNNDPSQLTSNHICDSGVGSHRGLGVENGSRDIRSEDCDVRAYNNDRVGDSGAGCNTFGGDNGGGCDNCGDNGGGCDHNGTD